MKLLLLFLVSIALPAVDKPWRDGDKEWRTPAAKKAIQLRSDLFDLGLYDDIKENWTEVESALREGVTDFVPWASRIEVIARYPDGSMKVRYWWRVMPITERMRKMYAEGFDVRKAATEGFVLILSQGNIIIVPPGTTAWYSPK